MECAVDDVPAAQAGMAYDCQLWLLLGGVTSCLESPFGDDHQNGWMGGWMEMMAKRRC